MTRTKHTSTLFTQVELSSIDERDAHQKLRGMLLPYLKNEPLHWNGEN